MHTRLFRFVTTLAIMLSLWGGVLAQSSGFNTSNMDRSAEACNDFFQYANGNWVKNTEIPASQAGWGTGNILAENNRNILKDILEVNAGKKWPKGSDNQLIGDYYAACMDEAQIEREDLKPLKAWFKQIDKMKTPKDVQKMIATFHKNGVGVVFSFGAGQDLKNSNQVIANAGQGGTTLPNKDYYFKTDAKSVETRAKFVEYVSNMFKLMGKTPEAAAADAKTVMDVQTRLANGQLAPVEARIPENRYNKIPLADAQKLTPEFSWADYLAARGVTQISEINMAPAKFFTEVNTMLREVPVDSWKAYMRFMLLNGSSRALPKRFVDENFNFNGRYLSGIKEQQPRWKRCVAATDGSVGEALGMLFVQKAFTPEAKGRMDQLISNLFVAMRDRIGGLKWMSDETKPKALAKLNAIKRKIGYPDTLRGYKGLEIKSSSYIDNIRNTARFEIARSLQDIGKPVDRTRWGMTPPTVNAYYAGTLNEIVFPAGILQPPFFNSQADDAINYGGIGGVIGHEISHGFDDQGSKFDAEGNLKSWWTDADRKKFEENATCVADQFNGYEVLPGLNINGRLTLGENIGDFSGLTIAYTAFMKSLEGKPRPADIDGFTAEQRFFLGWAQVWAAKATEEAQRAQVLGDPHSAAKWRVNGPMSNMPEFAQAFGCKTGQKMIREKVCEIW